MLFRSQRQMSFFVDVCPPECDCGRYKNGDLITECEIDRCCKDLARGHLLRESSDDRLDRAADALDLLTHKIMRLWAQGCTIGPFRRCPVGVRVATLVYFVQVCCPDEVRSEIQRKYGCAMCGKLCRTKPCPCKEVRYCTAVCQKKHWKLHKTVCKWRNCKPCSSQ